MKRMKLPRIPNPNDILNAKYTKDNMRSYAHRAMHLEREAIAEYFEKGDLIYSGANIARLIRLRSPK